MKHISLLALVLVALFSAEAFAKKPEDAGNSANAPGRQSEEVAVETTDEETFVEEESEESSDGSAFDLPEDPFAGCAECDGKITLIALQNVSEYGVAIDAFMHKSGLSAGSAELNPGDVFLLSGEETPWDRWGTLGPQVFVTIVANGEIEYTDVHTSCSIEIGPGTMIGEHLMVIYAESRNAGMVCPVEGYEPPEPECEEDCEPPPPPPEPEPCIGVIINGQCVIG